MDLRRLLMLSAVPGIGNNRLRALVSHFGSPAAVFEASPHELIKVRGIEKKSALSIKRFKEGEQYADQQLARMHRVDGRIVTFWDKEYPESLKQIFDPPSFLFVLGSFTNQDKYSVAIVGTRNPTSYGKLLAESFAHDLGTLGIAIVSGLARGIDTIAHSGAIHSGSRTIAVIGSGIDVIYPPENKKLAEGIAEHGAMISEFEMGAKPDAEHFPQRNRIISGLSLGTLVIETDVNGGAMLTARWALDQNREVFALPGPVTEKRSAGCNLLIKRGEAKLVQNPVDILDELSSKLRPLLQHLGRTERKPSAELTLFEKTMYDALSEEAMHIDVVAQRANTTTADALVHLLSLEFKGLVKQLAGKMFVRIG